MALPGRWHSYYQGLRILTAVSIVGVLFVCLMAACGLFVAAVGTLIFGWMAAALAYYCAPLVWVLLAALLLMH
jgi:hypothetical protein